MTQAHSQDVEQLVNDYVDLLNGEFSKNEILSESFTYHAPGMPEDGVEREGFEEFLKGARQRFSDLQVTLENSLIGDGVTMQEWKMEGTHDGEVDGIPPTGRAMELSTMTTTVVSGGKIREVREYFDQQELQSQLEPEE